MASETEFSFDDTDFRPASAFVIPAAAGAAAGVGCWADERPDPGVDTVREVGRLPFGCCAAMASEWA